MVGVDPGAGMFGLAWFTRSLWRDDLEVQSDQIFNMSPGVFLYRGHGELPQHNMLGHFLPFKTSFQCKNVAIGIFLMHLPDLQYSKRQASIVLCNVST